MGSGMKGKIGTLMLVLLVVLSAGCISEMPGNGTQSVTSSNGGMKTLEVYILIEEKDAAFEISTFTLRASKLEIREFGKPYLVLKGSYSEEEFLKGIPINLSLEGEARNWKGQDFPFKGRVSYLIHSPGVYVLMLEAHHIPGLFLLKLERDKSGRVGGEVPGRIFEDDEELLLNQARAIGGRYFEELRDELQKNRKLREHYLSLWEETGNLSYLQIYRDLSYPVRSFGALAKRRNLNSVEINILLMNLKANDFYYSTHHEPGRKDLTLLFDNSSPYYGTIRIENGPIHSSLPFVYYRARGFSLYSVAALHWAHIYYRTGKYRQMLEILNELKAYVQYEEYGNRKCALLKNYFQFQNASIPWVSGYAQGVAAGLYAEAYNLTGNPAYLNLAEGFLNSFELPLSRNGFVVRTEYGPWYLEYNYYPKELVLNGHIIALQGLYYYWKVTGNRTAWKLFWEGAMSVKKALPYFDTGSWSRYASIYNSSSEFYHRLHIKLLVWLYEKTGDRTFLEYAERWNGYLKQRGLKPEKIEINRRPGGTS